MRDDCHYFFRVTTSEHSKKLSDSPFEGADAFPARRFLKVSFSPPEKLGILRLREETVISPFPFSERDLIEPPVGRRF